MHEERWLIIILDICLDSRAWSLHLQVSLIPKCIKADDIFGNYFFSLWWLNFNGWTPKYRMSSSGFLCGLFLPLEFRTLIRCFGFEPRGEKQNPFLALIKKKMFVPMLYCIFGSNDNVKKGCVGYQEKVLLKSCKTVGYSKSMFHVIFCLAIWRRM